ncbi:ATP-dependent Clp protease proteolytic subunit [Spongiimicrobium salis]|uniref:ATP-dependent Clp protease proteolytic subunit n=1 Tax=Spongiimicrobium salis TaxID=1667022 RepID=UPI00374CF66C
MMTGYIGGWKVNSESLFRSIKKMEEDGVEDCDIFINSGGGSTIDGMTIGEYMEVSPIKFHGTVTGMAASMAGVILQSCDTRSSYKYARIMTHKVTGYIGGESGQIRAYADLVDQEEAKIVDKFIQRTGKKKKVVLGWMKSGINLWFDAKKAKAANLIDTIIDTSKAPPKTVENASEEELVNMFEGVSNTIAEQHTKTGKVPARTTEENQSDTYMKNRILTMLGAASLQNGLTENSSDDAVMAELEKVFASAKNETEAVKALDDFKKSQATVLVEAALKAGKITPAEKDQTMADAVENYALVAKSLDRMAGKVDPTNGIVADPKDPNAKDTPEILKGRETWNYDKWQDEDPNGLAKLHDDHIDVYNELFNKKFNPQA